ncbi:MAG: CBS domain-containing protein [Gemmatales bacterium]|nr:CBS domain-containing protein [Gemmatales bacterium]MDW8386457.1 CBS domain-containing protein [Gemmatales bacterium]
MICPNCGHDNLPGAEECAQCMQDLTHLDRPSAQDRIEKALLEEPVSVLPPARPVTVRPTETVRQAVQTMVENSVGAVLVVGDGGKLLGIFSERDVLNRLAGLHDQYEELPVSHFMTPDPETVSADDKLAFALHKMDGGGYRHLPVMADGIPQGIISVRDILRYVSQLCFE